MLLPAGAGLGFAALGGSGAAGGPAAFWPLLLIAFVGTLNPSSGDVSVFLPLEHARLAQAATGDARTRLFARYTLTGSLLSATGALAAALPDALGALGIDRLAALRGMFVGYGLIGALVWLLYRKLPAPVATAEHHAPAPLGTSRRTVFRLAALFSVDSFAGGLVLNSLMALWLFTRFDLSIAAAGQFFFWAGLLTAASQLAAPHVARRIGLLNTMVFTHIPANLCLFLAALAPTLPLALALLLLRSALSQMDVPTRAAFVMAVVTPAERTAAASFTAVPRSLASALSPTLADDGSWRRPRRGFLFPVKALSKVFRGKFVAGLDALRQGRRWPEGIDWGRLKPLLYRNDWVVYAKQPLGGPAQVIAYLGRYTHRVAISNERIVGIDPEAVAFRVRADATTGKKRTVRLPGTEFIRRFLLHVLPTGFKRIRHYGLLSPARKKLGLAAARSALDTPPPDPAVIESVADFLRRVGRIEAMACPRCGTGTMRFVAALPPVRTDASPRGPP